MTPAEALNLLRMLVSDYAHTLRDTPGTQGVVLASGQAAHDTLVRALSPPAEAPAHGNDPA